jgi:transketolase
MRTAFINALIQQARVNPKLFLVVGDLGFSVVEPFAQEFPDRYLNAGVAEQNMTGIAAGLASEGYHVFTYSIANFPTVRCLEQIRNDVCYHNLPVTITAVGGGLAYGNLGYTHHAVQDLAVMRAMPNITVLSPADPGETVECVEHLSRKPGPSYLRLGKAGEKALHAVRGLEKGPLQVRPGNSGTALVATGSVLSLALEAAELLQEGQMEVAVYSCPWLKPCDRKFFEPLWRHPRLVSIEEHLAVGGLGDLLRQLKPVSVEITSIALPEDESSRVGSQDYLRKQSGLSVEALLEAVLGRKAK